MWFRLAAALVLLLAAVALGPAQPSTVFSRAVPPDKAALERLNLRTEWAIYLPIESRRDAIVTAQTIDDQLFVQTRTGLLIAIDILTGQIQWSASLGNGGYANVYPVAANSRFVFATNVTKLFAFYRYSGVTEFVADLGTAPTTGLAADDTGIYTILTIRPGTGGAQRIAVYDLPRPIAVVDAAANAKARPFEKDAKVVNPVDDLAKRYPVEGAYRSGNVADFPPTPRRFGAEVPTGGYAGSRTASLAVLPRITPPYTLDGMSYSPSLAVLPSLRQPYHLRNEAGKDIQQTPSIGTIPPSVASALALSDLRPKGIEPRLRWEYGTAERLIFPLVLSPLRVWGVSDTRGVLALAKFDKKVELNTTLPVPVSAPPGQAGTVGYVPLGDGNLYAVDLTTGNSVSGATLFWRANTGGIMNRTPFVTTDAVYAAGDNSGVVQVDRKTGELVWRTDSAIDRVIASNQEFAYLRDRQGRLLVFDAKRATDPASRHSAPLTGIDVAEFNVPVVNTVTDRIYLAADNGLIVCIRDASAKYARPVRIAPPIDVNPPSRAAVEVDKKDPNAPPPGGMEPKKDDMMPKKDEMPPDAKKDEMPPKKDEPDPKKGGN